MSYHSAPYWWVTCDGPDCAEQCPNPDSGTSAWADKDTVMLDEACWVTIGGKHYCETHDPRSDEQ